MAASATATSAPTRPATPPRAGQVSSALSPLPKPGASPSAAASASPAAQGAPVSSASKQFSAPPPMEIDGSKKNSATIDTSLGTIKAELSVPEPPMTANNFVFLPRPGFYDGVPFHPFIN